MNKLFLILLFTGCSLGESYYLELQGYPYETDNSGGQLSGIWSADLTERAQFVGFADYDINDGKNRLVTHPGLFYRIWKHFGLVTEYRYNGYDNDRQNIAIGVSFRLTK